MPQSPTSGIFASFSQDFAGVGGDVNYIRSVADARGYYPITNKITLVGRAQGGVIEGWGGQDVRLTDLFFKGGETIRGFERAGYGPRDACENPSTGERIANCSPGLPRRRAVLGHHGRGAFPLPIRPRQPRHAGRRLRRRRLAVGSERSLPLSAVARGGQLHLRQRRDAPVDRIQHHLAVAARPAPGRYRRRPCSRPISTRPNSSASALRRTSKGSDFPLWLRVMAHVAALAAENLMEHPGFFERAGPFSLGAVAAGAPVPRPADGADLDHRHQGCQAPRRREPGRPLLSRQSEISPALRRHRRERLPRRSEIRRPSARRHRVPRDSGALSGLRPSVAAVLSRCPEA